MPDSRVARSYRVASCLAILVILGLSPIFVSAQSAQSAQVSGAVNWLGPDGNYPNNWDYVAQNQLNSSNVQNLQVSWIYPIAPAPSAYGQTTGNDIVITPVVVDGISYVITDYHLLMAQDLSTGAVIWSQQLPLQNFTGLETLWDADYGAVAGNITGHYHGLWYSTHILNQPLIWLETNNDTLYAYNALNGDFVLKIPTILPGEVVPGNYGIYGTQSRSVLIDDQQDLVIVGSGGTESDAMGRGFYEAYYVNSTSPTLVWRSFIMPPQDGSDPSWDISSVQNMSDAWVFNGTGAINLKTLPNATLYQLLYGDWGNFGYNGTFSYSGTDTGWGGSWALNQSSGIAYVGNDQPGADWNASTRPGPDLWSDSVMAINVTTGKFIWAFQTTAHDTWDFDCSWSVMLATVTINGTSQGVVYKGCKNGYFYALSADTGALLWYFDPPNIARTPYTQLFNPLNKTQMDQPWANYPSNAVFLQNPSSSGGFESDPAYNPNTNLVYVAAYNSPSWTQITPLTGLGVPYSAGGTSTTVTGPSQIDNTTIYALNASTGKIVWSYYIPYIGYRGGITTTSDILIVPRADGYLTFLDASNGTVLAQKFIGAALITEPAIATSASGNMMLVMPASGDSSDSGTLIGAGIPSTSPGFMFAMAPSTPVSSPQTVTSATSAASSAVSASTITVTQSATSTGVSPGLFDAVLALAIIFAVIAAAIGLFAMRRKQ